MQLIHIFIRPVSLRYVLIPHVGLGIPATHGRFQAVVVGIPATSGRFQAVVVGSWNKQAVINVDRVGPFLLFSSVTMEKYVL